MGSDLYVNYEGVRTSAQRLKELAASYQTVCTNLRGDMESIELDEAVKSALQESMDTIETKLDRLRQFIGDGEGTNGMADALLTLASQYEAADNDAKTKLQGIQL